MESQTVQALLAINRRFYQQFGAAFSVTRQRPQEGVRRVLGSLPDEGSWLDLGCGNGTLALEWLRRGRRSHYLGLDFSVELLAAARAALAEHATDTPPQVELRQADLSTPAWVESIPVGALRGALAFAVLHHLPSWALRLKVLRAIHARLAPDGTFVHSEWQFARDPKWQARCQPWNQVGLAEVDLDAGDCLLDWRFTLPGQAAQTGLRYVHAFDAAELEELAQASGFRVLEVFEADGRSGQGSLYQIWRKA
jgi:tRNA (uracil-5-)-methyltransferase TRM9